MVTDFARHKTIILHPDQSYLAKTIHHTRGHETVPGSDVRASMKGGPGPCVSRYLLVAKGAHLHARDGAAL
jgi:hypothetical protein